MRIPHDHPDLTWHGAISLERTEVWTMPWRIPHQERSLYAPPLAERASFPSGVRIAFRSDTQRVGVEFEPWPEPTPLDLCCDGHLIASALISGGNSWAFEGLPAGEKRIELWLPHQYVPFRLRHLELEDGATLSSAPDPRPRWITYGSSITHCRAAASPTQTWPAIVARERGLNLTSLGFGGQCHLDPLMACIMRDQPADFLSLCVGINIYGAPSLGPRTFCWNLIGFTRIVREKHPWTPMVVMSPICSPPRETTPNPMGVTLAAMRDEVAKAVRLCREAGDKNIHYVNGLEIFGPDLAHLLPDDLHPDAEGYRVMGRNLMDNVVARYYPQSREEKPA